MSQASIIPSVESETQINLVCWNIIPPKKIKRLFNNSQVSMAIHMGTNPVRVFVPATKSARVSMLDDT